MRFLLAVLVAVQFPASSVAAVIERMPSLEARPVLSAPALSVLPTGISAPALVSPVSFSPAAPIAVLPAAMAPSVAAAVSVPTAAAAHPSVSSSLQSVGTRLTKQASALSVLNSAFDGRLLAAADGPEVQEDEPPTVRSHGLLPSLEPAKTPGWRLAVPNGLTIGNMTSGLAAAFLASDGKFALAGALILMANLFDALDGRAARALKVNNPLGIDLDSLADVVSFGAAPALLIFKAALLPALGWWGFPIAAAFAAGGLYRLARFNAGAHAEKSGAVAVKKSDSFTGLPIPGGAGVIVALTLALGALPAAAVGPEAAAVTLLATAAMVSRLPYPAFKKKNGLGIAAAAGVAAAAVPAALGLYALIPAAVFGLYLATGPVTRLLQRRH